jgi:tryptophan synthase alpha chain
VRGASHGSGRVRQAFGRAADEGRTTLVVYLVAGFPDDEVAVAAAEAALDAGADVLEIGVPFSDPLADGPVIAEAARDALVGRDGLAAALDLVRGLRGAGRREPLLVMTYLNPLIARGAQRTMTELVEAGVDGLIVPDLPAGELPDLERRAAAHGLAMSFLVAPNSAAERVTAAVAASTGFLYVVPLFGVTGARDETAAGATDLLSRMKAAAGSNPIAAGFGISRPEHIRRLGPSTDGLIVGSAVVTALRSGGPLAVRRLVASLAAASRRKDA